MRVTGSRELRVQHVKKAAAEYRRVETFRVAPAGSRINVCGLQAEERLHQRIDGLLLKEGPRGPAERILHALSGRCGNAAASLAGA